MAIIIKVSSKISIHRKTKILRCFFVCLFIALFCIGGLQAQVAPELTKARAALANTPRTIYVTYQEMRRGEIISSVETDILTFTEHTILSNNLSEQGYSEDGAAYRVKINPDGSYTWQAIMLHKNNKDTVLMKGDLKNGVMTGVIVYQLQDGTNVTGNFTTVPPE